jgi:hypothetical protein
MPNNPEENRLSWDQQARLLRLGLRCQDAEGVMDPEDQRGNLFYDILSGPLPVDEAITHSIPTELIGICQTLRSVAGEPIWDLLHKADVNIILLQKTKEYAKQKGSVSNNEVEHDVFLALYYVAIACGLIFHGEKITQHSYQDLEQFFSTLSKKPWIPQDIAGLLLQASEYCRGK